MGMVRLEVVDETDSWDRRCHEGKWDAAMSWTPFDGAGDAIVRNMKTSIRGRRA